MTINLNKNNIKLIYIINQYFIFIIIINKFDDSSSLINYNKYVNLIDNTI